jgi:nucleotide-binding universal stress UspA family protein
MGYGSILVACDFSEPSLVAMRAAGAIVQRAPARLEILHVEKARAAESAASTDSDEVEAKRSLGELRVDELSELSVELRTVVHGSAAQAILDEARQFDLCVVGTHGRTGIARLVLGSVSERVVRHAECDVLVARAEPAPPWQRVVVATDFSEGARAAAIAAHDLARRLGATLTVVHVFDPGAAVPREDAAGHLRVAEVRHLAEARLEDLVVHDLAGSAKVELLTAADAGERLVSYVAHQHVGLLVVGTHGRSGIARLLIGSVSERLVRLAPCSVLVVRDRTKKP